MSPAIGMVRSSAPDEALPSCAMILLSTTSPAVLTVVLVYLDKPPIASVLRKSITDSLVVEPLKSLTVTKP